MKRIAGLGAALTVIGIVLAVTPAAGQKPSVRPVQPAVTSAVPAVAPQVAPTPPAKTPPPVAVQWHDNIPPSSGVIDQIAQKYTLFLEDGSARPSTDGASVEKNRPPPADDDEEDEDKGATP